MIKFLLPGVIILSLVLVITGFILSQRKALQGVKAPAEETVSTATDSPFTTKKTPAVTLPPIVASSASESALVVRINELSKQVVALQGFDTKVDNLEKQIDDLNTRLSRLESPPPYSAASPSPGVSAITSGTTIKGAYYIYALGYGGSTNSTDWTEVSSLNIAFDPANYPGYKSLQLEAYMRVRDGNGKAFARLYASGTVATASEVTSTNYQDEWVSGGTFTWNTQATFTLQIKTLNGYDTYLNTARLKINY